MSVFSEEQAAYEALDLRVRTLLPAMYQDCYEEMQPVSMGTAGLKFGADGKVAWDEIWGSFCNLAMAGGPPHKGSLLEPGTAEAIAAEPEKYRAVVEEICRGIGMVTDLRAEEARPGWVRAACPDADMAGWLARAIVMENVSARCDGAWLELPSGPGYRVEKEIKNVITSVAKTYHYRTEHMWPKQEREIAALFAAMAGERPLVQAGEGGAEARGRLAERIVAATGLAATGHGYRGWLGLECGEVGAAIWMMRALVASNVMARREGTALFVPAGAGEDGHWARVAEVYRIAVARGVMGGAAGPD